MMLDFTLHFSVSLALFFIFFAILHKTEINDRIATAVTMVLVIGLLKECYDFFDYGLFSLSDFAFDFIGAFAGMIIVILRRKK